jgi:predicted DNA-binding transcriptional regulator AlpA
MASATKLVKAESQGKQGSITSTRLLTAEDVGQITGLSTETLAQWRSQRKGIPFLKLSRNVVRYQQGDLDAWLAQRIVRVEADPSNATRRI